MNILKWWTRFRGEMQVLHRARKLSHDGNHDRALHLLNVAQEIFPDSDELKLELARSCFRSGQFQRGMKLLKRGGINALDGPSELFRLGERLEGLRRHGHAMGLYQLIAEHFASHEDEAAVAHFKYGRLLRVRGQKKQSIEEFIKCLELDDYGEVFAMAHTLNTDEERMELMRHVPKLERLAKSPDRRQKELNLFLSDIFVKSEDFERATPYVAKARNACSWPDVKRAGTAEGSTPRFIVIGTAKSGTTALYHTLDSHPSVRAAIRKEVHFFQRASATRAWYLTHFPKLPADKNLVTGEASPNYFAYPIQQRIKEMLPDVKLICILRNPTRRAISQFFHGRRHGNSACPIEHFFRLDPFHKLLQQSDDQIEAELFAYSDGKRTGNQTIAFSLYYFYLRRWFRFFDTSQLLLLTLEEFSKQPQKTMEKVCEFVGIEKPPNDLPMGWRYQGKYTPDDPQVLQVAPRLDELYREPTKRLEDEFGIRIGEV